MMCLCSYDRMHAKAFHLFSSAQTTVDNDVEHKKNRDNQLSFNDIVAKKTTHEGKLHIFYIVHGYYFLVFYRQTPSG